jgi:hypothetical protein
VAAQLAGEPTLLRDEGLRRADAVADVRLPVGNERPEEILHFDEFHRDPHESIHKSFEKASRGATMDKRLNTIQIAEALLKAIVTLFENSPLVAPAEREGFRKASLERRRLPRQPRRGREVPFSLREAHIY